uniref:Capsid protein n=1 Tax=Rosellinia necatrix partitivirus 23 TaxID=2699391 RepID=A0A6F8QHA6_9VIRU|nr:capsid protein [Rosellinia necatrix partitivirus 23]
MSKTGNFKFDPDYVASLNAEQAKAYILGLQADTSAVIDAPKAPAPDAQDPVGSRDVVREARQELVNARTSAPAPSVPVGPKAFTRSSDRSAANAIRQVYASNPLTARTHFGLNFFIPNFLHIFQMLYLMDRKMVATDKFTRTSEFWTPLVTRIYISVLLYVQILLAMQSAGRLDGDNELFLEWFLRTFKPSTLPIPGPIVNLFATLSNAAVSATNYKSHAPTLPPKPHTRGQDLYLFTTTLASRLPNVPALLNQYHAHLTFALPAAANNAETIGRWPSFGHTVFAAALLGAAPATAFEQTAVNGANNAARNWLFQSPGFLQPLFTTRNIGSNLQDYAPAMLPMLPAIFVSTANALPNGVPTWRQFLGLQTEFQWFTEFARIMTDYCKFFKESCSMADIAHVGHSGSLIRASNPANLYAVPATRFATLDLTMSNATSYTHAISESDEIDGCVALFNTDEITTTAGLPVGVTHANPPLHGGPYYALATAKTAAEINPVDGFGQILTDHYHVANPKA